MLNAWFSEDVGDDLISKDDDDSKEYEDGEDSSDVILRNTDQIVRLKFLQSILRQTYQSLVEQKEIHTWVSDDASDGTVLDKKDVLKEVMSRLQLRLKIQMVFDEQASEGNTDLLENTENKDDVQSRLLDS